MISGSEQPFMTAEEKSSTSESNLRALTNDPFSLLTLFKKKKNPWITQQKSDKLQICKFQSRPFVRVRLHPSPTFCAADPRRALEDTQLFCSVQHWLQPPGTGKFLFSFFFFFSLVFSFYTPTPHAHPLPCQLPGFRGVKACIIFHQLSVLISTKAAAMEQPLRLFAGLNFTDVRLLSFPRLNAAQRGWICKTNAAVCVWGSRVAQKGRFSQPMGWRKSALCRRQINQKQRPACRTSWLYGAEIVADFSVPLGTLRTEPGRCWGSDGLT